MLYLLKVAICICLPYFENLRQQRVQHSSLSRMLFSVRDTVCLETGPFCSWPTVTALSSCFRCNTWRMGNERSSKHADKQHCKFDKIAVLPVAFVKSCGLFVVDCGNHAPFSECVGQVEPLQLVVYRRPCYL